MKENNNILTSEYFWNSPFFKVTKFAILFFIVYLFYILCNFNLIIIYLISAFFSVTMFTSLFFKKYFIAFISITILISSVSYFNFKNKNYQNELPYVNDIDVIMNGKVDDVIYDKATGCMILANCNILSNILPDINSKVLISINKYQLYDISKGEQFICKAKLSTFQDKLFIDEFPKKQYAKSLGANFFANSQLDEFSIINEVSIFQQCLSKIKSKVKIQIQYLFPDDVADLISSITIGDKSLITSEKRDLYSITGSAHILAVSGLHIGIIALFVYFITFFFKNVNIRNLITIIILVVYLALTGFQDSSIRATLMIALFFLAIAYQRYYELLNILSFTSVLFVILEPKVIYSISFQFTILAVLGILLYNSYISNYISNKFNTKNKLLKSMVNIFVVSISATILLSPLVAYYFQSFTLLSYISNLYVIPLITIILVSSIPVILISFLSPALAYFFSNSIIALVRLIDYLNIQLTNLDFLYFSGVETITYSLIVLLLITIFILNKNYKQFILNISLSIIFIYLLSVNMNKNFIYKNNYQYEYYLDNTKNKIELTVVDFNRFNKINYDNSLADYLLTQKKEVNLYYNDNNGQYLYDKLKDSLKINLMKLE